MISLKGRDFISLKDFSKDEIDYILELAFHIKKRHKAGGDNPVLSNRVLAMIFKKASTRTRIAFEVGMYQLGGSSVFLSPHETQIGRGEPIEDTARVLSGYVDAILIRTFDQQEVEDLAKHASVPVINGLTDLYHPTQIVADMMTIIEEKGTLKGINLTYIGDGNNVAHSLLIAGAIMGMNVTIATPECYGVKQEIRELAESLKSNPETILRYVNCPFEGAEDADVLYTDVWASMGQEEEAEGRRTAFSGFQLNEKVLELAKSDAIVMHCLPAYKGQEISADVFEKFADVIFSESENRLHAHKGIMAAVIM